MSLLLFVIIIVVIVLLTKSKKSKTPETNNPFKPPESVEDKLRYFMKIAELIMQEVRMSCISILCVQKADEALTWFSIGIDERRGILNNQTLTQLLRDNHYNEAEINWLKSMAEYDNSYLEISCEGEVRKKLNPDSIKQIMRSTNADIRIQQLPTNDKLAFSFVGIMKLDWNEKLSTHS